MGIGGGSQIIQLMPKGLYNRNRLVSTNLYVDGELVRYKGQYESNMVARCPEEAIAKASFLYLCSRTAMLATHFGKTFTNKIVYMDGSRVQNKIERIHQSNVNDYDTRKFFKQMCLVNNYKVVQLDVGESELQMYIQRDKRTSLNVFLTRDSDMLSILYSHKPSIINKRDNTPCVDFTTTSFDKSTATVEDRNDSYNNGEWTITDSCVWAICDIQKTVSNISMITPITMIGFDYSEQRVGFNTLVWRSYCVLCGTDFTSPLFTDTMRRSALQNITFRELEYLNDITKNVISDNAIDIFPKDVIIKIIVTLLVTAMRSGTLKKKTMNLKTNYNAFNKYVDLLYENIRIYFIYI